MYNSIKEMSTKEFCLDMYADVIKGDYKRNMKGIDVASTRGIEVEFMNGKKFIRVVTFPICTASKSTTGIKQKSCHSFIDIETGDIYKAASWSKPRKNYTRGNIYNIVSYRGRVQWTGVS